MITVRGIYNGKTIRPVDNQHFPDVDHEVPVVISFPFNAELQETSLERTIEAVEALLRLPEITLQGTETVKDLIEYGRRQ